MKVKILVENTKREKQFESEHGLSMYLETDGKKILFDFGRTEKFMRNGRKLGVAFEEIDFAVLSHGHYDHGNGLPYFLESNEKAMIYMQEKAMGAYFSKTIGEEGQEDSMHDIGLNETVQKEGYKKRFFLIQKEAKIGEHISLYSGFLKEKLAPSINNTLYKKEGERWILDDFQHELAMLIEEQGKYYLFAGCAHNGIVSMIEQVEKRAGIKVDVVLSGFHLHTSKKGNQVGQEEVKTLGAYLKTMDMTFYTGHCTGEEEYQQLKEQLGAQMHSMRTGDEFVF